MGVTLEEVIKRFQSNAEYERTHGNLQGCLEFRQLVEWLKDYKRMKEQAPKIVHWISNREHCEMNNLRPSGLGSYFWCSECDCGIDVREWHRNNYNFCPNCGAKMGVEDDTQ